MTELGPTEPYPSCDKGCAGVRKWLEAPKDGIYDVHSTTLYEPQHSCQHPERTCVHNNLQPVLMMSDVTVHTESDKPDSCKIMF